MKIYLYAESGSTTNFKIRSMRAFTSALELGKKVIQEYIGRSNQNTTLEKFISYRYNGIKIYEIEPDSLDGAKKINPTNLWKMLIAEDRLKPEITKALLKSGS
jgi:hypothetical protein